MSNLHEKLEQLPDRLGIDVLNQIRSNQCMKVQPRTLTFAVE